MGQSFIDEATVIQKMLKDGGIDASLNLLQRPAYSDAASYGKGWQGIVQGLWVPQPDPLSMFAGIKNGTSFTGTYIPQEYKDVWDKAIITSDFDTKKKLVQQLMELATDKYCMITHYTLQGNPYVKWKRVHDDGYGEYPMLWLNPMTWKE